MASAIRFSSCPRRTLIPVRMRFQRQRICYAQACLSMHPFSRWISVPRAGMFTLHAPLARDCYHKFRLRRFCKSQPYGINKDFADATLEVLYENALLALSHR